MSVYCVLPFIFVVLVPVHKLLCQFLTTPNDGRTRLPHCIVLRTLLAPLYK
jgi:hypothetical protein